MDDSYFGPAFVDVDEWRDTPVRHRYVHGGFEGTDTRFSFYFPPAEQWRGRLLQPLEGGNGGHENTAQGGDGLHRRDRVRRRERLLPRGVEPGPLRRRHADPAQRADGRRLPRQRAVGALLVGARGRDVRRGAAPRLRLRRQRRLGALPALPRAVPRRLAGRGARTSWATPRRGRWASRCRRTRRACSARRWPTSSTRSSPVATAIRSPA